MYDLSFILHWKNCITKYNGSFNAIEIKKKNLQNVIQELTNMIAYVLNSD